jgi:DNA-binding beta-propeller fold protein YncE
MNRRWLGALAAAAILTACAGGGGGVRIAPDVSGGDKLYVVNQGGASITVVDQARLAVDTVLDLTALGFSANAKPHHVAVEPDGSAWYVSLIGDGRVLKFDRANRLLGQVAMETPGLLSLDPVHDSLYVGRSMTAVNPPKALGVIRRSSFTMLEEQEILITRPHALATSRDGRWVHAASLAENRIASTETATGRVTITDIPGTPRSLVQFTVSPDGRTMVAGGELSNTLLFFDLTARPPFVPTREIAVGAKPWDPVFSPDGRTAYITLLADNAVAEVDVASATVRRTMTGKMAQPYGAVLRRDGKVLFVVNQNSGAGKPGESGHEMHGMAATTDGWLTMLDTQSGEVLGTLMLGAGPTGAGAAWGR